MCSRAQVVLISGSVLASLNRFDSTYFPIFCTVAILVVGIVGHTIFPYYINGMNNDAKLYFAITICGWIHGVALFYMCAYYVVDTVLVTFCGFKRWKLPCYEYCCSRVTPVPEVGGDNNGNKRPDAEMQPYTNGHIFFRLAYCTIIMAFILLRAVLLMKYPMAFATMDDSTLLIMIIPPILLASCVLVFNLRLVKHEAVESLIGLLDAKKSYVRYISHGTYMFFVNQI